MRTARDTVAATRQPLMNTSSSLILDIALPPGGARPLLHDKTRDLPHGAAVIGLALEIGMAVEGVDDEERALVAHRHVLAVALQGEDHLVLLEILKRDLARIVVERHRHDPLAAGAD